MLDLTPDRDDLDPIERASIGELRELQLERLRRRLSHVYEHVAHYRAAFDEAGVDPDDVGSLEDLARFPFSDEPEHFDDPDSFLAAVGHGSGPGYGDMRGFIGTVTDDALAGRLSVAIQGKGAFRRFKDTLYQDEPWWGAWLTFSNQRQLARARWWLADAGLRPATDADGLVDI